MGIARLRALTPTDRALNNVFKDRRNGDCPTEGIDTHRSRAAKGGTGSRNEDCPPQGTRINMKTKKQQLFYKTKSCCFTI